MGAVRITDFTDFTDFTNTILVIGSANIAVEGLLQEEVGVRSEGMGQSTPPKPIVGEVALLEFGFVGHTWW